MTRTEQAVQRRRMSRKIRETVALRRFNATLLPADRTDDGAAVIAEHPSEPAN